MVESRWRKHTIQLMSGSTHAKHADTSSYPINVQNSREPYKTSITYLTEPTTKTLRVPTAFFFFFFEYCCLPVFPTRNQMPDKFRACLIDCHRAAITVTPAFRSCPFQIKFYSFIHSCGQPLLREHERMVARRRVRALA